MSDAPKFKTFRDLKSVPKSTNTSIASKPSSSSIASTPRTASSTSIAKTKFSSGDISPVRDFQKVPNSIPRNLDLFRGKSKMVWDYLWSVSRGAINPTRTIRKSRKEIKENSKLGSMVTVDAAIEHLVKVGLIQVVPNIGSIGGNEYEIFTPEELDLTSTTYTSISSTPSSTSLTQKLDILDVPLSGISSISQAIDNKDSYSLPNTSFKDYTKNDDDTRVREAFGEMSKRLDAAVKKLTGKGVSKSEAEKWGTLADVLILELEVAASRADSISSVPAFLTEVLRRQFFNNREKPEKNKSSKQTIKKDTVGKSNSDSYEVKPLDQKGREEALANLSEFADDDFLPEFKKWYVEEDWKWLMEKLKSV